MSLKTTLAQVASIQVGKAMAHTLPNGKEWVSAIGKQNVSGQVAVHAENMEGDEQADRRYHGGPHKAVCWYAGAHYPFWRETLHLELSHGAFGENITLSAATEEDFCIGDVLQVGTVIFQVSQPRFPCVKPGRLWNRPRMPHLMEETGFTGFYTRVQHTGVIEAGQSVVLLERPHPGWTIARANRIMHAEDSTLEEREGLRALEPLAPEWKRALSRRLQQREG